MIIIPYSTALKLAKPPWISYAIVVICVGVFLLQNAYPITDSLKYYPQSWNPLKMLSSSLLHGDWVHLIGNMVFFLAFAPALETLLANGFQYIRIIVLISLVAGLTYSISVLAGSPPVPTLGFSAVVMGMIGLSAYLMTHAKIRVFGWFVVFWKVFYLPAWLVALFYIGFDCWELVTADDYGGINLVAHVAGGISGYLYGFLRLKERKVEVHDELEAEIRQMAREKQFGKSPSMSFRGRDELQQQQEERTAARLNDRFMSSVYKMVSCHRDSDALYSLMKTYDPIKTQTADFENLFNHIEKWGPSRTLLCIGRLIIHKLDEERRYGRAIAFIERCQHVSELFELADVTKTAFYARWSRENGKPEVGRKLMANAESRYAGLVRQD